MGGYLLMSSEDRSRLKVMEMVSKGMVNLSLAASMLNMSYRQVRRVHKRYKKEGDKGLIHKNRGRVPNSKIDDEIRNKILSLYKDKYPDFGPTFATEKLLEKGYDISHETLRLWLLSEGLWQKHRKRKQHRSWRERRGHFGELIQMDGSHHEWFEERGEKCCLMNMVDDATSTTMALFASEETTRAAMNLLWRWIEEYGVPIALYTDKKNVFVTDREPTMEEQLKGEEPLTQFGRACKKFGISIIKAHSAQAKGRVERSNGVYQDRLIKELRLEGINTIDEANRFLYEGYLKKHNSKFAIQARENADCHRPINEEIKLETIFCFEEDRTVSNDWTIRYKNRFLQIVKQTNLPPSKSEIIVQEHLDGSIHIVYKEREVTFVEISKPTVISGKKFKKKYVAISKKRQQFKPKPRKITRLLSLAHHYQKLLDDGQIKGYTELAIWTNVSTARISQVMSLLFLAPEIQKIIINDNIDNKINTERQIRKIVGIALWEDQIKYLNNHYGKLVTSTSEVTIAPRIKILQEMSVSELREQYCEAYGKETKATNKTLLLKKIAWHLQEIKFGGVPEEVKEKALNIVDSLNLPGRIPTSKLSQNKRKEKQQVKTAMKDKRLPMPGTVITKKYKNKLIRVEILDDGFEYEACKYHSLSAVAKIITGSHLDGSAFFGL